MHSISKFKKGFTLVELLIAASIVAILAMFSLTAYRNSVVETRIAGAKAKADTLSSAYQRFMVENPGWYLADSTMADSGVSSCSLSVPAGSLGATLLLACGYVEKQGWDTDPYFTYKVYQEGKTDSGILACAFANNISKIPAKFHGKKYCVKRNGEIVDEFKNL